jgi:choline dehydrogenase-like flavoprotein
MADPLDAIIIGSGAGGGTLALHLARAGKRILILERGPFLPQEKLNWNTSAVFLDNRYHTKETWQDKDDKPLHPQQAYYVGGQTKVYGAAMFRMRAEDFGVVHIRGASPRRGPSPMPTWSRTTPAPRSCSTCTATSAPHPRSPAALAASSIPTEPFHSKPIRIPFSSEPRMAQIEAAVRKLGVRTFPIPLGLKRNAADPVASRSASAATPATAIRAWSTPSPTPTSTASARSCICPTSR